MYKILKNIEIANNIYELEVENNLISSKYKPGEFVIVMTNDASERIPLTIVDVNKNTITLIYQVVGASTYELSKEKEKLYSICGPLGNYSKFIDENVKGKKFILVGGGIGIAPIYPQAKYLYNHGAIVDIIYGAKNKDLFILKDKLESVCNNITYVTDDGSSGIKGFVTDELKKRENMYDEAIIIGPVIMMKNTVLVCRDLNLKNIVSLNPIMVDGTGMCGACRVLINNEVKFACVDGPEFDGFSVDFDSLINRMNMYKTFEGRAYLEKIEGDKHQGGCGEC